jgi:hypothetical protein
LPFFQSAANVDYSYRQQKQPFSDAFSRQIPLPAKLPRQFSVWHADCITLPDHEYAKAYRHPRRMRTMKRSDEMIEMLVSSVRDDTSERDKAVLRRVLCELVRVAQAESVQSIEADLRSVEMAISSKYRH